MNAREAITEELQRMGSFLPHDESDARIAAERAAPTVAAQQYGRDIAELTRWLRELADPMCEAMPERERLTQFVHAGNQAATLIQSQAARIAELEAGLGEFADPANWVTAEQRAGYRILGPGELDAETLERVAEFTQNEFQRDFESPVGWRGQFVAAIRALKADRRALEGDGR